MRNFPQFYMWSKGGRGIDEPPKWSHFYIFCASASAKVCRVIVPKLAGSDFELSHTIFKCWQTHEIHHLECRVKREEVQKDAEHDVLSDAIDAQNAWLFFTFGASASAKVCRIIFPKLKGSDFELSHTIFKCWQTHEIKGEGDGWAPKMVTFIHFLC